jgi:hypothetical protein
MDDPQVQNTFSLMKTTESENEKKRKAAQISIMDAFEASSFYKFDNPMHLKCSRALVEMIALDNQPFSIVEDMGFKRYCMTMNPRFDLPSRKWLTENQLPKTFLAATNTLRSLIQNEEGFWFTSDLWSTEGSSVKMLSLTCHYMDCDFILRNIVLASESMPERHTAENISQKWISMFLQWNILKCKEDSAPPPYAVNQLDGWEKNYGIITDNGANMRAAINLLPQNVQKGCTPCLAHTIQLVIEDAIESQRAIIDTLAVARNLVRYFKKSGPASEFLASVQHQASIPRPKVVIQDVCTRWDSELLMLERLVELRPFLAIVCSDEKFSNKVSFPNDNQWKLINSLVTVLSVFRVITKEAQENSRPTMHQLILHLQLALDDLDSFKRPVSEGGLFGVDCFVTNVVESFQRRVIQVYKNLEEAQVASFLSPNSKGIELDVEVRVAVENHILEFLQTKNDCNQVVDTSCAPCSSKPSQPPSKLAQKIASLTSAAKIDIPTNSSTAAESAMRAQSELKLWNETPLHPTFSADVCEFWRAKSELPNLQIVLRKALGRPSSSAESERLFSKTGLIYCDQRSALKPENVGMLVTISSALKCSKYRLHYV